MDFRSTRSHPRQQMVAAGDDREGVEEVVMVVDQLAQKTVWMVNGEDGAMGPVMVATATTTVEMISIETLMTKLSTGPGEAAISIETLMAKLSTGPGEAATIAKVAAMVEMTMTILMTAEMTVDTIVVRTAQGKEVKEDSAEIETQGSDRLRGLLEEENMAKALIAGLMGVVAGAELEVIVEAEKMALTNSVMKIDKVEVMVGQALIKIVLKEVQTPMMAQLEARLEVWELQA